MFLFKALGGKTLAFPMDWWYGLCHPESENKPESQYFRVQTLGTVFLMKRAPVFIRFYLIKWTTLCSPSVRSSLWASGSAVCVPGGMSSWFRRRAGTLTCVLSLVWPTFITGGSGQRLKNDRVSHHENHLFKSGSWALVLRRISVSGFNNETSLLENLQKNVCLRDGNMFNLWRWMVFLCQEIVWKIWYLWGQAFSLLYNNVK